MKDKRIAVKRLTVITQTGPFQAKLYCDDGRVILAHYKHGILSLYADHWAGEELMAFPLNVGEYSLDDGHLETDEFKALLGGLIRWPIE